MQIKSQYRLAPIRLATIKNRTNKTPNNKFGKDVEKSESLSTVGGKLKGCSYYKKQYGGSPKN